MNFLDAHKILHTYIGIFKSIVPVGGLLRRESKLKDTKKDILIKQIYMSVNNRLENGTG